MWLFEPIVVVREVTLLFFALEFLIGATALGLALFFKRNDALSLFLIGFVGNTLVEIAGLITGMRLYDAPPIYKPFIVLSIGMGEAGAGMCLTWWMATKAYTKLSTH